MLERTESRFISHRFSWAIGGAAPDSCRRRTRTGNAGKSATRLVLAQGTAEEVARAREILAEAGPTIIAEHG
jgi:hypothetical protein